MRSLGLCLLLTLGLLGGCATAPPPSNRTGDGQTGGTPGGPGTGSGSETPATNRGEASPGPARPSSEGATLALLQQSDRAEESGSLDEALSYVERAVRIEPRRGDLWTRLAALELSSGNPDTAIQYARKALSLATDRPDWQRDAWLVIADAKDALGEHGEASAIRQRWQTARG